MATRWWADTVVIDNAALPSEKAREMSQRSPKKRPLSKGPKKRAGGNHGNGQRTRFKPGQNSHDGTVFRRGPDDIPRGSATLMLKTVMHDKRQTIYDSLCTLVEKPLGALAFTRELADRTEGKPTQKHQVTTPRETIFRKDPDAKPAAVAGPGGPAPVIAEGVLVDEDGQAFVAVRQ